DHRAGRRQEQIARGLVGEPATLEIEGAVTRRGAGKTETNGVHRRAEDVAKDGRRGAGFYALEVAEEHLDRPRVIRRLGDERHVERERVAVDASGVGRPARAAVREAPAGVQEIGRDVLKVRGGRRGGDEDAAHGSRSSAIRVIRPRSWGTSK